MDSLTSIFTLISIRPRTITELRQVLPYSRDSIYKSVHQLHRMELIEKVRVGRTNLIHISRGYRSKLLRDLFMKAAKKRVISYKNGVELCRRIIRNYPGTKYEHEARMLLRQVPEDKRKLYKITDEELGL